MSYTEQLLGTIDARIAEAHEQIGSLEGALEALLTEGEAAAVTVTQVSIPTNSAAPKRAAAAPKRAATARKRAARARKPRRLDADGLTAILEPETDGLSAASIAERANASYNQVLELLREREQAGDVVRTGARRSSLWRLITDEERIAARAAELAARA
jgi:predicted Rossmann fold nucleotide-binding protein DprA/Smf involved in DNA uptake